jgi:hypothetical protein
MACSFARLVNSPCRRAAMMPIRDIQEWNLYELFGDEFDSGIVADGPGRVAYAVIRREVHFRNSGDSLGNEVIHSRHCAISQKHRAGLRIKRLDVAHAIIFLVRPGELVLLDDAIQIFLATGCRDQTDLRMFAHNLAV